MAGWHTETQTMAYLVGIDLGSTNLKAVVYDVAGRAIAQASRPNECVHCDPEHPQWSVWQPEAIWAAVSQALREATAPLKEPNQVKAVAVTGMGMDGLPVAEDGRWLYPLISWHCPRTEPQYRWWLDRIGTQRQFAIGGNQVWAFNTALRILWMEEHQPQILEQAFKWLLIEDYVNFQLCGRMATDYSMASTTLLFDQRRRTWSDELLDASGIDRRLLCKPLPSGTVLGEVHRQAAEATGVPVGTPVVLGGHDYCCGMLPTGAFRPGVLLDVTGTWEMVVTALPRPVLTREALQMGIVIDSHVARGMWSAMGATVAADMLEWFRREFGFEARQRAQESDSNDWDYLIQAAAASPPGASGVMFLPHMSGSHCPVVDPQSAGAWVGLRNTATKGDLLRAMIEGLGYEFRQVVEGYESGLGVRPDRIVAIGGAIHNELWMQNKADVAARPIEVPELDEAVPLGAAILAGIGVGIYRDEEDAFGQVYRPGRTYEPDRKAAALYADRFACYKRLHPALRGVVGTATP